MPTKPKTYPYAVYYCDNSYMVYDLTKADYGKIIEGIQNRETHVVLEIGILVLKDIRSVIQQKEEKVSPVQEKEALPPMSLEERTFYNEMKELGLYDVEDGEY